MQTVKKRTLVETEYAGANVSCITTERGLVLIDSPFLPRDGKAWANLIRERTGKEIAYVINTDNHYDHVMGNAFLTPNVICHTVAEKEMGYLRNKPILKQVIQLAFPDAIPAHESDIDELEIISPHITFDKELTLDMGDATIHLEFAGGHSPGTILIYFVEDKVLFTGDNVEGQIPFFGQANYGQWKDTLKKMLSMDIDAVVPGHGPVSGIEMVETYSAFFLELEEEVNALHTKGLTIEEMAKESEAILFFPLEGIAPEEAAASWIGDQYRSAAKAILAERRNMK